MKIPTLLLVTLLISGCGTITPNQPVATVSSFNGNIQNSGFLGYTVDHYGIITQSKLDEYNTLVQVYGLKFAPPLSHNDGIVKRDNQILIDKEHMVKFAQMLDIARKTLR